MKFIDKDFIEQNKENFRDSFKVAPTKIRQINLGDFKDGVFTVDTIENTYSLTKEEFLNSDKDFYVATNVNFKNGVATDKTAVQNTTGKEINDSWIINENIKDLGYKTLKNDLFVKESTSFVPVMEAKEELAVNVSWSNTPLQGKVGDMVAVYGEGDYNIIDRETFYKTYQFKEPTIEDKIEFAKYNKEEKEVSKDKSIEL